MDELEVRELRSGEESLWFGSDAAGDPDTHGAGTRCPPESEKLTEFRQLFEERSSRDPRSFLVALAGARAAGRLKGLFLNDKLYFIQELHCAEGLPCSVVEDALACYLGDSFSSEGIGILSWDRTRSAEINAALERAGFEVEKKKTFVARGLKGELPECEVDFTFRSLFEVGKPAFLRTMTEAAQGDPFEDVTDGDPEADFNELVEGAGNRFDPASWMLALVGDDVVGVVLPQEFPGHDKEGTLFYVALRSKRVPTDRHAALLQTPHRVAGARSYRWRGRADPILLPVVGAH